MRKSFSVIVMSTALLITGGAAADAAGVATATSAGTRKVIKTVSARTAKGGPVVVKTRHSTKVIKTAAPAKRAARLASAKPTVKVIKTAKRR